VGFVNPTLYKRTLVAHHSEIWAFAIDNEENNLFTGSGDGELKAWRIDYTFLEAGMKETESGEHMSLVCDLLLLMRYACLRIPR
jgi:hypothetical protein